MTIGTLSPYGWQKQPSLRAHKCNMLLFTNEIFVFEPTLASNFLTDNSLMAIDFLAYIWPEFTLSGPAAQVLPETRPEPVKLRRPELQGSPPSRPEAEVDLILPGRQERPLPAEGSEVPFQKVLDLFLQPGLPNVDCGESQKGFVENRFFRVLNLRGFVSQLERAFLVKKQPYGERGRHSHEQKEAVQGEHAALHWVKLTTDPENLGRPAARARVWEILGFGGDENGSVAIHLGQGSGKLKHDCANIRI
ncbi:asparagine--tRNA ligase [Striga asiatica]|uniref:Asparagine--tRNA ligase n=1 Tax=Striga asiatica TaxID=4170 RepID=A0A5A7PV86_STRAF|nr:asparagine--tRNA ligase [Striga asiatica]